jgi:hypothetical protein
MGHDIFSLFLFFNLVFPLVLDEILKSYCWTNLCASFPSHHLNEFFLCYRNLDPKLPSKKEQRTGRQCGQCQLEIL